MTVDNLSLMAFHKVLTRSSFNNIMKVERKKESFYLSFRSYSGFQSAL